LQGNYFQDRQEQFRGWRDEYGAIGYRGDFAITFGGYGDRFSAAAFDVFEHCYGFLVAQDGVGIGGVARGQHYHH
jgi:hypothetical protein